MASAELPGVERKKKSNVMYAFICSILASMASIILGYGTQTDDSHVTQIIVLLIYMGNMAHDIFRSVHLGRHRGDERGGAVHQEGPEDQ